MPRWAAALLVLVTAVVSMAVQAGTLTVYQNNSTAGLYGERFNVGENFFIESTAIRVAKDTLPAVGTQGSMLEITDGMPRGNTAVTRDQWTYEVVVKEAGLNTVTGGNYSVEVLMDDASLGKIFVTQQVLRTDKVEGAILSWLLGATINTNALFVIEIKPFLIAGPLVQVYVEAYNNYFLCVAPTDPAVCRLGTNNAQINASLGSNLKVNLQWRAGTHNFQIVDAVGGTVLATTATVTSGSPTASITWAVAAGATAYQCEFHQPAMAGTMVVA